MNSQAVFYYQTVSRTEKKNDKKKSDFLIFGSLLKKKIEGKFNVIKSIQKIFKVILFLYKKLKTSEINLREYEWFINFKFFFTFLV